jgi:hypothetical protein
MRRLVVAGSVALLAVTIVGFAQADPFSHVGLTPISGQGSGSIAFSPTAKNEGTNQFDVQIRSTSTAQHRTPYSPPLATSISMRTASARVQPSRPSVQPSRPRLGEQARPTTRSSGAHLPFPCSWKGRNLT